MKERPILMSAPMVRAILDGRKTQTRRAVKRTALEWLDESGFTPEYVASPGNSLCPYGYPGDWLWVREAFLHSPAEYLPEVSNSVPIAPEQTVYRADVPRPNDGTGWKPSIHMPRRLCRIVLELTAVRVERLHAISESDAEAEGVAGVDWGHGMDYGGKACYVKPYRALWETINGAGSWEANRWVWVLTFKRLP